MRHLVSAKKLIRNVLLLTIPFLLIVLATNSTEQTTKAEDDELVVSPRKTPNPPPKKFIGIWMTNGYGLQPNPNYYTTVGEEVVIRTDAGRSIWTVILGVFDSAHYRWWQTTDGKKWTEVSKSNNGHRKNFSVTPKNVGTVWYQLDTQYYTYLTPFLKTHIYSNLTAVHTLPDPVDATSLDVTVDDDYLYSTKEEISNTTYAHATPDPINATGKIKWSVDNTSLATIDPDDGHITANNKSLSGNVEVTATMTNPNTEPIYGSKTIRVGGGLDDQKVNSGEDATFTLLGDTGGDGDDGNSGSVTIDWYRTDPITSKESKIYSGDDTSYTIKKATMADDQALYKSIVTFQKGAVKRTLTSNKAKLTVVTSGEPDIKITNKITDESYPHTDNTDHQLNDVVNSDKVTYQDTLTNVSQEGPLQNGNYVIPLRSGTQIDSIKIDGEEIDSDKYSIIFDNASDTDDLVIKTGNIQSGTSKQIEVNTTVLGIFEKTSLTFTPYVFGDNDDGTTYRQEGVPETINYISDKVHTNITNMNFGSINAYSKNKLKHRPDDMNNPNNIVNVNDQRRDKHAMKVFVSQDQDFISDNGSILPASLRYYENGQFQNILGNLVQISESDVGTELDSIAWNKEDGLLLHIDDNHLVAGKYSTTLTWNFENTI